MDKFYCTLCNLSFTKNFGYIRHLNTAIKNNNNKEQHFQLKFDYYKELLNDMDSSLILKDISDDNIFTIYSQNCDYTYTTDYLRPCTCPNCVHQRLSIAGKKANTEELKQHKSKLQKAKWSDSKYRELTISNMVKAITPETRQTISIKSKQRWQDPEYRERVTKSIRQSYTPEVRAKMSVLLTERWQDPEYKQRTLSKIKMYNLNTYGTDWAFQAQQIREKIQNTMIERYNTTCYLNSEEGMKTQGHTISNVNKEVASILEITEFEFRLESKSYDLKKDDYLIEVDPYYTHNVTYQPYIKGHLKSKFSKYYHRDKTLLAEKHNYQCIHIFDWDDLTKIKELISPHKKIYARNTEVKEISTVEANVFLNSYHLQGQVKGQQVCLGLYYKDELIEVMTFGKPRYNQNYQYELLRLCSANYSVIGGASKLFSYFIKTYNPKSIISYCDRSKFTGSVYLELGFTKLSDGQPARHWYNPKLNIHITDNLLSKHGFTRLVGKYFNITESHHESNEVLMLEHGFVEIYDCGQAVFIWK